MSERSLGGNSNVQALPGGVHQGQSESRRPCVLLLDGSFSMAGAPIRELNQGLLRFYREVNGRPALAKSLDLAVLRFAETVQVLRPLGPWGKWGPTAMRAEGGTPMGEALRLSLQMLHRYLGADKPAGRAKCLPWLIVMSDGQPTDEWEGQALRVQCLAAANEMLVLAVGIGDMADMDALKRLCSPQMPPKRLKGLSFVQFFEWLGESLQLPAPTSPNGMLSLPPSSSWAK